jgi:putative glycosyltransferase (TIGR04348 family)
MRVRLVTPTISNVSNSGNRVTAERYAGILRKLGHRVAISASYEGQRCDMLLALHARKSSGSIRRFREQYPDAPLIVVLTGTDLYRDLKKGGPARASLELATRLVVLQHLGLEEIPQHLRAKARVIYQSADCARAPAARPSADFRVCVAGHLRPEKDPFRTAMAARVLPAASRVKVIHIGAAIDPRMEKRARHESELNPRYRWVGGLPRRQTRQLIAGSDLVAITSKIEGSSNVLSESLACSVPVVASKIPGLVGTLGRDYPGFFAAGNTGALADLLWRAESDSKFYADLRSRCRRLANTVRPEREIAAWRRLLEELCSR